MNSKKATIFDYARMCNNTKTCNDCSLRINNAGVDMVCSYLMREIPDKANETILKWCEEHPVKTRQGELLKMFPKAKIDVDGALSICPQFINKDFLCQTSEKCCSDCCKDYWLAEVDE